MIEALAEAILASEICQVELPPVVEFADEDFTFQCKCFAAWSLARHIAAAYPADFADVWDALCHVPDDILHLLESATGWMILADRVVRDLGILNPPVFITTVH